MTDAEGITIDIERFEVLLRTSLDEVQRLTIETMLGEAREKLGRLQPTPLPIEGTRRVDLHDAMATAANNLTKGANLDELREAAFNLRELSPSSVLADLVDAKIEKILAARAL
jgi:hypothetical protein